MANSATGKPAWADSSWRDPPDERPPQYSDHADPEIPLQPFSEHKEGGDDDEEEEADLPDPKLFTLDRERLPWYRRPSVRRAGLAVLVVLVILFVLGYFRDPIKKKFAKTPPPRKAIVIASYSAQNVTWTKDIPSDWEIFRYVNDDSNATFITPTLTGREAAAYLTYIIDNYDDLPDYTVFVHGHDQKWHQIEHIVWKAKALNFTALEQWGYFNLRCSHHPGCTEQTVMHIKSGKDEFLHRWTVPVVKKWIEKMYPDYPAPDILADQCCAQFAATKATIRSRTKEWWEWYRTPILMDADEMVQYVDPEHIGAYGIGVMYEKTWHLALNQNPVTCPSEKLCRETFFSDAIHCDKHTGRWKDSQKWFRINCTAVFDGVTYRSGPQVGPHGEHEIELHDPDDDPSINPSR